MMISPTIWCVHFSVSGYTTDEIKRICESDILAEFRKVLLDMRPS